MSDIDDRAAASLAVTAEIGATEAGRMREGRSLEVSNREVMLCFGGCDLRVPRLP